ncbi:MAG: hypothetical protein J3K34DRAFT_399421 [Monoraphidium minutum]|nr:MAG: hypothetical protein J3K34DRAFT_399421 [Monoraphidium minutum]
MSPAAAAAASALPSPQVTHGASASFEKKHPGSPVAAPQPSPSTAAARCSDRNSRLVSHDCTLYGPEYGKCARLAAALAAASPLCASCERRAFSSRRSRGATRASHRYAATSAAARSATGAPGPGSANSAGSKSRAASGSDGAPGPRHATQV